MYKKRIITIILFLAVGLVFLSNPTLIKAETSEKTEVKSSSTIPENVPQIPKIYFTERKFDFGEIEQGTNITHVFKFENKGHGELVIDKVKTSCGCTAALLSAKNIKPGDSGEIKATFKSGRFKGAIKKTVYVHSNDPKEPVIQLRLTGVIKIKGGKNKKKG